MKHMSFEDFLNYFSHNVLTKGLAYAQDGSVLRFDDGKRHQVSKNRGNTWIDCLVQGSRLYRVLFPVLDGILDEKCLEYGKCNCPHFAKTGYECKHLVAAVLCYMKDTATDSDQGNKYKGKNQEALTSWDKPSERSSQAAENLLSHFQNQKQTQGDVSLVPYIYNMRAGFPYFGFRIGRERMYVVKRMDHFFDHLRKGEEEIYGKSLTVCHTMNQFTELSQKLILLIENYKNQAKHYSTAFPNQGKCVQLDGNSFSLFFDLYLGQTIRYEVDKKNTTLTLEEGNPTLHLVMEKDEDGAEILLEAPEEVQFFGNDMRLYAVSQEKILRCDPNFSKTIFPILDLFDNSVYLVDKDIPTFCALVLPVLSDIVTIQDEEGICESFSPDDCTPCFYFDISPEEGIMALVTFQYGDQELPEEGEVEGIRRNMPAQAEAKELFSQDFIYHTQERRYYYEGDKDEFLTETLYTFYEKGIVFLSSRLQGKFVTPDKKPVVGISVAQGVLTLDMDLGEFPLEELEALYTTMLKKQKYHKLKDGRFLKMEDSGFEKVAEISHMLQLSPKDMKKNKVVLPAYRGLYLDAVLEKQEGVQINRNQNFRHMMRDFKALEDSDYLPSEDLQTQLRPYQVLGFQWLKTLESYGFGGILADEMGLGKTVQVITFLLSLEQDKPSLIVCPASLLLNWAEELEKFAPSLSVLLLLGSAKERKAQLEQKENLKKQVWVTSYDLLKRDREQYSQKEFYACILDEAQNVKNKGTLVSQTVKSIVCERRFVLTGTPIENRLSELWNLFDFLMPGYLYSHNAFLNKLEKPIVQSEDPQAKRQLHLLVQPFFMRRLKKDVLKELPNKMEQVRKIHLSEEERKLYASTVLTVKEKAAVTESKLQILALLTQLRQLCCDPNLVFENYTGDSSKLTACLELCASMKENGHKILLFSQFTTMLDRIRERLNEEHISNLTIEGSTSKKNRAKYVKEFQEGKADVFLISLKAGGTGLNLTQADVVIHYDPWWNQAAQNQATDRAHRIGQTQHVQVYKLITQGTIEEKILTLQEKKASLMESVLSSDSEDLNLSTEDILALLE